MDSTLKLIHCADCSPAAEEPSDCHGCVLGAFARSVVALDAALSRLQTTETRQRFWSMLQDYAGRRLQILK